MDDKPVGLCHSCKGGDKAIPQIKWRRGVAEGKTPMFIEHLHEFSIAAEQITNLAA